MDFLKRLFGGGGSPRDPGLYIYIKPKACNEIVQVRINTMNDLSLNDKGDGYHVRKMARGNRCPFPAEIMIEFDKNRRILSTTVENGEEASEADYRAFIAEKEGADV